MRFLSLYLILLLPSCGAFFVGRSDSFRLKGERVEVTIRFNGSASNLHSAAVSLTAPASIVGVLAGLAIDTIVSETKREAANYEAQFTGTAFPEPSPQKLPTSITIKRFLPTGKNTEASEEIAFEFEATFEATLLIPPEEAGDTARKALRELKCWLNKLMWGCLREDLKRQRQNKAKGLRKAKKGANVRFSVLRLTPSKLKVAFAKAKILSDDCGWWFLPTAWVGKLFGTTGHHVSVQVDIALSGIWVDAEGKIGSKEIAISIPPILVDMDQDEHTFIDPPTLPAGVFPQGTLFSARITVTEKDPSNAKRYLESLAKAVSDNKVKVIKIIEEK